MQARRRKLRSNKGATEIAQFPLTLYCLFLVLALPVLNLVTLIIAGTTAYLATNDLAAKAATQPNFSLALNAMTVEAYNFQANTLAQFVKMVPQGGYTGCGNDLYVLSTNIGGAGVQSSAADQTLTTNIDTTKSIYEMQVVSSYSVSPLVSLASLPLLGSIPGLGQPVTLSFAASRPIEHPGGMQTASNQGGNQAPVIPFNRIIAFNGGTPPPTGNNAIWRTPDIFAKIAAAGQSVVTVNVIEVPAQVPTASPLNPWYATGITVQPGQTVWIDTQAVGAWGWNSLSADANGLLPMSTGVIDGLLPDMMLIGWVGAYPPLYPYAGFNPSLGAPCVIAPNGGPNFIPSGNSLINYPITTPGPLSLACNDDDCGDYGYQMVRVIITR
jgi:hypothetical protein